MTYPQVFQQNTINFNRLKLVKDDKEFTKLEPKFILKLKI